MRVDARVAERGGLVGVSGRTRAGDSRSARRMNWMGCSRGEPGEVLVRDRGLLPLGVDKAKDGISTSGSGVVGGMGGLFIIPSARVVELIHFSSRAPIAGGDSGTSRKASAKCSLMNLGHECL